MKQHHVVIATKQSVCLKVKIIQVATICLVMICNRIGWKSITYICQGLSLIEKIGQMLGNGVYKQHLEAKNRNFSLEIKRGGSKMAKVCPD